MGPARRPQAPCFHFQHGELPSECSLVAAMTDLSKKSSEHQYGYGYLRVEEELYEGLQKAESSLAIQLRTGINGFNFYFPRPGSSPLPNTFVAVAEEAK